MDTINEVERRIAAKMDEFGKIWSAGVAEQLRGLPMNDLEKYCLADVAATANWKSWTAPKPLKPLSPRRARELRDRRLKRLFGSRRQRAERFARLVASYGLEWTKRFDRYGIPPHA
jgi:hypothetical protein